MAEPRWSESKVGNRTKTGYRDNGKTDIAMISTQVLGRGCTRLGEIIIPLCWSSRDADSAFDFAPVGPLDPVR
jgi:hypothetical protein